MTTRKDDPHVQLRLRFSVRHGLALLALTGAAMIAAASLAPARSDALLLGITAQSPASFSSTAFSALGIRRTRLVTPWNAIFTQPARLDAWFSAVRAARIEPVVAFNPGPEMRCPASPCRAPSVRSYTRAFRAFHRAYPWVRVVQPWNEANSRTQPTNAHPELAAAYYKVVRAACPRCTVPVADLEYLANLPKWLKQFRRALGRVKPRLWGFHNYPEVNAFVDRGTLKALKLLPGKLWLTETGGIVHFETQSGVLRLPTSESRAAKATRYAIRLALKHRRRIDRIYLYQWESGAGTRWDSGIVDPAGRPRAAYDVIKSFSRYIR